MLEMLGVIVGFSAVMFLLSLVVTALVEAIKATAALRGRFYEEALARLLDDHGYKKSPARTLLDKCGATHATSPRCSALTYEDLEELLPEVSEPGAEPISKTSFRRMEAHVAARLQRAVRSVSMACAFIIAFSFQVSAPALWQKLFEDADYRRRALEAAEVARNMAAPQAAASSAEAAVRQLSQRHPELAPVLEKLYGHGLDRAEMQSELRYLLEDRGADPQTVLAEYNQLLGAEDGGAAAIGTPMAAKDDAADEANKNLAHLAITPWPRGMAFYFDGGLRLRNLLGVLLTAVLLTLGAPFWYERLRSFAGIRDVFAERAKKPEG